MNRRSLQWTAIVLALTLVVPSVLFAQAGSSLSGRVEDESGGGIPGGTVTATSPQTGLVRTTVTGSDGSYRFPSLPIGVYTLTADLSGFSTVTTENVELRVATGREINITLRQATVTEAITVTAEAPL